MGHAEMLLAVAGLNELQVQQRVEQLASGDWSAFEPRERVVLFYAKALSQTPQHVPSDQVEAMIRHWGPDRTLDFTWHIAWCNFMTRVADAYQIPLERTNVFLPTPAPAAAPEKK